MSLIVASCTSSVTADEPREVDIVTVFGSDDGQDSDSFGPGSTSDDGQLSSSGDSTVDLPMVGDQPGTTQVDTVDSSTTTMLDDAQTTTSVAPSTTEPPATTLVPTTVTTVPSETWTVGLLNQEDSQWGSFTSFRVGVAAAIDWANGDGYVEGDRFIELIPCASSDAATAASCASTLLASGSDVVIHGVDTFSEVSRAVLDPSAVATLGGIAVRPNDASSTNAVLAVGGPPAEHAGLAAAVVSQGFGATAILHDDTTVASDLVAEFIIPVLEAAGVSHIEVPIPLGTVDATGAVAPAAVSDTDSWIIVTSSGLCQPVIVSRSNYGVATAPFFSSSCTSDDTMLAVGHLMEPGYFTTELVTPLWYGVVSPDLRDARSLASAIIAQSDPALADDQLALMGYVAATAVVDQLRRGGASLENALAQTAPQILGAGELDCGQSPTYPAMCSGDILLARYLNGELVAPPEIVNGIRGR